jgi:predicted ABC-type ATPase
MADEQAPGIYVLAGTNGAGKSSVLGAVLQTAKLEFYNPDSAARELLVRNPYLDQVRANGLAWQLMRQDLEGAIRDRAPYAFETTLGGHTITRLLRETLEGGMEVHVWYIGLDSPERHIARVKTRVARGGHAIPEQRIRDRFDSSRANLGRLLPKLTSMRLYDNSHEGDPPEPRLLLHAAAGRIVSIVGDADMPEWAKPIAGALS